jgi:hypothetical protein
MRFGLISLRLLGFEINLRNVAVSHLEHPVCTPGQLLVVCDHDNCQLCIPVELLQNLDDFRGPFRIKVSRRLIGQEYFRPIHHGPGYCHPLHLAARDLAWEVVFPVVHPKEFQ